MGRAAIAAALKPLTRISRRVASAELAITIYIQKDDLGADKQSNWLPAPAGRFDLTMRLYGAETPILKGSYWLPANMSCIARNAACCRSLVCCASSGCPDATERSVWRNFGAVALTGLGG